MSPKNLQVVFGLNSDGSVQYRQKLSDALCTGLSEALLPNGNHCLGSMIALGECCLSCRLGRKRETKDRVIEVHVGGDIAGQVFKTKDIIAQGQQVCGSMPTN